MRDDYVFACFTHVCRKVTMIIRYNVGILGIIIDPCVNILHGPYYFNKQKFIVHFL